MQIGTVASDFLPASVLTLKNSLRSSYCGSSLKMAVAAIPVRSAAQRQARHPQPGAEWALHGHRGQEPNGHVLPDQVSLPLSLPRALAHPLSRSLAHLLVPSFAPPPPPPFSNQPALPSPRPCSLLFAEV